MMIRIFSLLIVSLLFGCSNKQEITLPTNSAVGATSTFKMLELGGGDSSKALQDAQKAGTGKK